MNDGARKIIWIKLCSIQYDDLSSENMKLCSYSGIDYPTKSDHDRFVLTKTPHRVTGRYDVTALKQ